MNRLQGRRVALAVAILAPIALLAAACTSGSRGASVARLSAAATTASTPSNSAGRIGLGTEALAFARCMRAHGLPNWPDPTEQRRVRQVEAAGDRVLARRRSGLSRTALARAFSRPQHRVRRISQTISDTTTAGLRQRGRLHALARVLELSRSDLLRRPRHFDSSARRRHQLNAVHPGPAHLPAAHPRRPSLQQIRRMTHIKVLALGGLVLLLAACTGGSSGKAAPPVAHLTASSGATTSPNAALHAAGECMRQHGLPNFPDPVVATDGPAAGQGILDKSVLKSYPDAVALQAITACSARNSGLPTSPTPELHKHQPAGVTGAARVGPLHPRTRRAELPRPESHHRRRQPAARPEQELPEHPGGDTSVPVASSSRRSQPRRIVGGGP